MKVCDKTCIFGFFPIINKYFVWQNVLYFLDAPRIFTVTHRTENLISSFSIFANGFYLVLSTNRKCNYDTNRIN